MHDKAQNPAEVSSGLTSMLAMDPASVGLTDHQGFISVGGLEIHTADQAWYCSVAHPGGDLWDRFNWE